jgi:hypothetical protein
MRRSFLRVLVDYVAGLSRPFQVLNAQLPLHADTVTRCLTQHLLRRGSEKFAVIWRLPRASLRGCVTVGH